MAELSPIDFNENRKRMKNFIFDEDLVLKSRIFPQLKLDENTFAYGLLLPKEIDMTNKKGEVIGTEQVWSPVLITSDRRLIEATKEVELNYKIKFESIPEYLPLRWSLDSIKSWLESDDKVPELTPREVLEQVKYKSEKISAFRNPTWYKVNSCWDSGTYVSQLFDSFPLKEERGLTGTGKTKEMMRSSCISFNATDIMINPSESTLFRETHDIRPTKYIDEAEKLFTFKKGQVEADSRVELINGSYTKGSSVPRVEKIGNSFVVVRYQVYSPTRIGSINGLYGSTEGRSITQIHTRSLDNDSRGEIEVQANDPDYRMIRENLYLFSLRYWKQIENIYRNDSIWKDLKLKKRDMQLWKPILTIAKLVGDDWFDEILDFAIELSEMKLDDLLSESSFDYECLYALKECIRICDHADKHYLDQIKDIYCRDLPEDQKGNRYLNRNIGQHLKKIGFAKKRDNKASYIIADKQIFDEIVSPISPQLAFLSTLSTLSTPSLIKQGKIGGEKVAMSGDSDNEKVAIVAMSGDSGDDIEMKGWSEADKERMKRAGGEL